MNRQTFAGVACVLVPIACAAAPAQGWKPAGEGMHTRWARDVTPENVWPEYPRPTMKRERWQNLNGLWDYAVVPSGSGEPREFQGSILVPFPIESSLSGVARPLEHGEELWYRRTFRVPSDWRGGRVLLHFGAVDWRARVILNGQQLGVHEGGYDGFEFDLTDVLKEGDNELRVAVMDPTDTAGQPRGKQVREPNGIWYTRSSGIWQTVWLEPVPKSYVRRIEVKPDLARRVVDVRVEIGGDRASSVSVGGPGWSKSSRGVHSSDRGTDRSDLALDIDQLHLWTPEDPYLSALNVSAGSDRVTCYVGLRDIAVRQDQQGVMRIHLNGRPLFQFGPLDQGFWPDGLYTAPTLEAMRFDIEAVKKMGGNMLRKHVKVEPELFYAECDRLGVLVWQDVPSANNDSDEAKAQFERELAEIVKERFNHPSIVTWVPFNEGWGQHDTNRITGVVRGLDPTRLVDNPSGWTDEGGSDVHDVHVYPGPGMAPAEQRRGSVLGEFGGLGLPLEGHTWVARDNWGYRSYANQEELTDAYVALLDRLPLLIGQGLSAAVYTQTTDVEIECNGWLTYDREVWKIDPERAAQAAKQLFETPPTIHPLVAIASEDARVVWRFTTEPPAADWFAADFDDRAWSSGPGGFGTAGTPGAFIGTEWSTNEIWLRRTIELDSGRAATHLSIHHDEDAEVYLNGELAASFEGYSTTYVFEPLSPDSRAALHAGTNVLAIHCKQTAGGQYIDAGLVEVRRAR